VNFNHFFDSGALRSYHCAPMPGQLPERVDPVLLANRQVTGSKRYKLSQMHRLSDNLYGELGEVEARFSFFMEGRRPTVAGELKGGLPLQCQCCMQRFVVPVDHQFKLAVVAGLQEAEELPEDIDPLLLNEDSLILAELVEDELLLLLPFVPLHPEGLCTTDVVPVSEEEEVHEVEQKRNPFAVLADLKRNGKN